MPGDALRLTCDGVESLVHFLRDFLRKNSDALIAR